MNFELACLRARLMAQFHGRAVFVISLASGFEATTNPPNMDCIRFTATVPHLHPNK